MRKTLFLLLAVAAVSAAAQPKGFADLLAENGGIAVVLLTISVLLAGIVYMVGNFIANEKVKVWAKTEVVEIFYSGVLLAVIVGIVASGTGVAEALVKQFDPYTSNLVCGKDAPPLFNTFTLKSGEPLDPAYQLVPCHIRVAKNFLATIFFETSHFVKAVGITHSWYTYLSSFSIDFTPVGTTTFFSGAGYSHSIFGFLNAKNNALQFLFENGVKILILTRFQEILLNFIAVALFPILLTAGLVLRTFMLTRKLGGLLMAMALSLYFIYPIFYVMGDIVLTSVILHQNYDPSLPPEQRPALAAIFTNFTGLPPKLNDVQSAGTGGAAQEENTGVVVNGAAISQNAQAQMDALFNKQITCEGTEQTISNMQEDPTDADLVTLIQTLWGSSTGSPVDSFLSGAYTKGATWNPASFDSVITGIDVLAKALFFAAFFSFISIFVTISGIKTLSPILGGDVEIAGLTHLI
ncbi:MAG: hypothetical protein PHS02_00830 [Candidatus ainarchaeum sp.]|nr:hypothetical protein [Candidatus ainarchaeum sp.]